MIDTYLNTARTRAKQLGLKGRIEYSDHPLKKLVYIEGHKHIHFGSSSHEDYLIHHDPKRRQRYRKRARGIIRADGRRAIDVRLSPAWLSYNITW